MLLSLFRALLQALCLLIQGQCVNQGIQIAVHDGGDVEILAVTREPVVGDPVLGEIIGADLAAAVTGAHLRLPLLGDGGVLPLLLRLVQAGAQDLHGPVAVLVLAALVLALHHRAGG